MNLYCFLFVSVCGTGDQNQGLAHDRQVLYHQAIPPDSVYFYFYFFTKTQRQFRGKQRLLETLDTHMHIKMDFDLCLIPYTKISFKTFLKPNIKPKL